MLLTANQAIQKASDTGHWAVGMCDNFVANMFGLSASGYTTAVAHWNAIPAGEKHPGNANAPAGALVFWGGGDGHVAIADGAGNVYSTDISGAGTVTRVPLSTVTQKWGKPYLGWSTPYFSGQSVSTGGVTQASLVSPVSSLTSGLNSKLNPFEWIAKAFGTDFTDVLERLGLILMGSIIVLVGIFYFTKSGNEKRKEVTGVAKTATLGKVGL